MAQKKTTRPNRRKQSALRPASSPRFDRFSRRGAPAALALGLLTGVCYLPAMLWGGLIWDDPIWSQSPAVLEWSGLGAIWSWPSLIEGEKHYWPLTYTTFWLEHKIWGLEPSGYHVVNVLLHLLNSLLLWRLLVRLAVPGAWIAAAVFAAHPLHVESVAWIIERKDVLSGLFYLTAVLAWLRFLERPRPWRHGLALLLFAAGLLSKSVVVTLPVALLIVQWWKSGRITGRDLQRLAPFFLVALLITALDLYSYDAGRFDFGYTWPERVLIASRALWFYAGKLAWPTDLAVIYPLWAISLGDPWAWLYLAATLVLAGVLWLTRHRIGRGPLAGALFFAVTLSPALGFVDFAYMSRSLVADRFQYLAGIGVMAVAIGAAVHCAGRLSGGLKMGAAGLLMAALALLGTKTWRQAEIYRDRIHFFSHIVSVNPAARGAHFNLSNALIAAGRSDEALAAARIVLEQRPDVVLEQRPDVVLEQRPDYAAMHTWVGKLLAIRKRFNEAEENYRRALELDPRNTGALGNLGGLCFSRKRYQEALDLYRKLAEVDPEDGKAHQNIGVTLYYLGRPEAAIRSFEQALSLDPTLKDARAGLEEARATARPTGE